MAVEVQIGIEIVERVGADATSAAVIACGPVALAHLPQSFFLLTTTALCAPVFLVLPAYFLC